MTTQPKLFASKPGEQIPGSWFCYIYRGGSTYAQVLGKSADEVATRAAEIVRATNSHAALVERLEIAAEQFEGIAKWFDQFDHRKSAEQARYQAEQCRGALESAKEGAQ